jgi:glycosyltransferase involved in cell wall biosynthesis
MGQGVPVLAAPNAAIAEVADEAALVVEQSELAAALARLDGDATLRARLADRGRQRARAFSWAQSARAHLSAYTLAAQGHGRR